VLLSNASDEFPKVYSSLCGEIAYQRATVSGQLYICDFHLVSGAQPHVLHETTDASQEFRFLEAYLCKLG
jgi:hypothetical protein